MKTSASLSFLVLAGAAAFSAEPVTKTINLLDVIKAGAVEYHVNPAMDLHDAPKDIWKFAADGSLVVSGRGHGYVATGAGHRDYHLVLEFKWGTKTWGRRGKSARDCGVIVHGHGSHGAFNGTWMAGVEAQIIEGGTGDILVLTPQDAAAGAGASVVSEFVLDRDKERIWKKGAPRQTVATGRINWKSRDEDWVDRTGFRGKNDVESPPGEWNRLEVVARGGALQYFVNGALVNEASDCKPAEGKVALQSEGAEMIVRRFELHPPGAFAEKWTAIQASGGSDITVRAGQAEPLSPEESLKRIQLDGPYEAQLAAAEPLVLDPVECTWDAQGRMFVADMRDYPLGPPSPGDPWLSRIQLLTDENGDGRMDKAVTFADHVDHVQGLLPYRDGIIATTRTQILFLKDTDGDGRADEIHPLIKGFNPRHSQLLVSAPRWGFDGCVHFNNGLDAKEIYPADAPGDAVSVPGSNFKWDPRTGRISPTGGKGQYGGAFDDWGRHFYCSNRNPVMFTVMPWEAMAWNPHAGITQNFEDIAPSGAETRVFPLQITHTTADAHAGTNTACCGLGVYRGPLMPELGNNIFVPDPTGQLVTRYTVEPDGASLKAARVGNRTEFFRSADEWCRPVNFTTGPDGAIYICDIYRRWIDHARFFPEEFVKAHDMRQGEHHGRIWRIVPKGTKAPKPGPAPEDVAALKAWLDHPNAWQRETAGRLLVEKTGAASAPAPREEHEARRNMFRILDGHDAGATADMRRVEHRARLVAASPEDAWLANAALSSSSASAGRMLRRLAANPAFAGAYSAAKIATFRGFAAAAAAAGSSDDFAEAMQSLDAAKGELTWWKPAFLQGLADGLPRSGGKLGAKTLAEFVAKPPKDFGDAAKEIGVLLAKVDGVIADPKAPTDQRLAALPLLGQRKWDDVRPFVKELLAGTQPPEMSAAAFALLKKYPASSTAPLVYELLPTAGPALKRDLVSLLTANGATALEFFRRMEKGEFPTAWVDVETRWRYQRGKGEMADLAKKLFGEASSDRAAVVASYMDAARHPGDAEKGGRIFATICVTCHRHGQMGVDVGPPLSDVKAKPPEALLSDILDPNRMFEARWSAYQIDTADGRILSGLIQSETRDSVVLAMMGGAKETLPRSAIKEMKSLDRSLMPPGLEAAITKEQMSDLLAFLRGR